VSTRAQARPTRVPDRTDPRRTRRAGASRHPDRRRFRVLLIVGVVALLVAAAWGVSVSPLLDVDHVHVRGLDHLTTAEIESAADIHPGDAMAWLDPDRAVNDLEALPYVGRATVSREWPDTVRITVRERRPAAWVEGPGGKTLVDGSGRVLETVDAPPAGLPQLLGTKVVPPVGGTVAPVDGARVAGGLTGFAAGGTASVEVTDHGVLLHLVAGPEIRMGGPTQIAVKVRAALAVLGASSDVAVQYVDVSVPTNPVAG
jgi:cell division protein FtsQ